jgi:NitT/TauT family transport system substrate-binding protein
LQEHNDMARKIAAANVELTQWIKAHPEEAQKEVIAELKTETKGAISPEAVAQAWKRIKFTSEISPDLIKKAVRDGKDAGFSKGSTDTSKLVVSF